MSTLRASSSSFFMGLTLITTGLNAALAAGAPTSTDPYLGLYPLSSQFEEALPNEAELAQQIELGILNIQATNAKLNGHQLRRGTHAKGVCARADMEIFDVGQWVPRLSQRLKVGIFANPGRYPAQVRFANAAGTIRSDEVSDVRAVSFSLMMPESISNPQGRMDFSMNDASYFPIGTAQVFADLMLMAQTQSVSSLYQEVGWTRANAVLWALGLGQLQETQSGHWKAYQMLRYWSDVPFALGPDEAVKYSLKPCSENRANEIPMASKFNHGLVEDALSLELKRHLLHDNPVSCFDFQVQLLEPIRMRTAIGEYKPAPYWVENADVEWNEVEAPFYTVGRLTLQHGATVDSTSCENWHFDLSHNTNATHHGLGSINRVRGVAEAASARARLTQSVR